MDAHPDRRPDTAANLFIVFAGALTGVYPHGCLEELRDEWPPGEINPRPD